ncbi:hypothetical protein NDU88_007006 [Pleurodeles waltl]|uniref:Secreted protein n=1 Tax=Pleurodeles waltl TaxID=8319 RepID=A0AAV7PSW4_PLEWA|nr:hypothetical protein NDU88_007006 [Pleurodeles waltl]
MRHLGPAWGAPGRGPTAVRPAVAFPPSLPMTSLCCRQKLKKRPRTRGCPGGKRIRNRAARRHLAQVRSPARDRGWDLVPTWR